MVADGSGHVGLANRDQHTPTAPSNNVTRLTDPIAVEDGVRVAQQSLKRRVKAIASQISPGEPLRVVFNTRKKPAFEPGFALSIDWTHRFDGRLVKTAETWQKHLLPALETVAQACDEHAHGRKIVVEGLCALPAAVALGSAFLATRRLPVAWRQVSPKRSPELWSIDTASEPSGFVARVLPATASGDDLAVLVSVASDVRPAFAATRSKLPAFRGLLTVTKEGAYPHDISTPGQAADIARVVLEGLRQARTDLQPRGTVHLFLAVPAGLAMMIGQTLNTFGLVQTHEHIGTDAVGVYHPAALLHPSA